MAQSANIDTTYLLSKLYSKDNIPHALLFTGVLKRAKISVALLFAKWVLGDHAQSFLEFGKIDCRCDSCLQFKSGAHHDFILIEDSPVHIREIRSLKIKMSLSPFFGKKKVAVISNAESLRNEAANSMLKLLEEPGKNSVIVLISPARSSVLKTISSRTAEIRFFSGNISPQDLYSEEKLGNAASLISTIEKGLIYEKFDIAKMYGLENKNELAELLDIWLLKIRKEMREDSSFKLLDLAKKILKTKSLVLTTNASPQLLLEELALGFS